MGGHSLQMSRRTSASRKPQILAKFEHTLHTPGRTSHQGSRSVRGGMSGKPVVAGWWRRLLLNLVMPIIRMLLSDRHWRRQ